MRITYKEDVWAIETPHDPEVCELICRIAIAFGYQSPTKEKIIHISEEYMIFFPESKTIGVSNGAYIETNNVEIISTLPKILKRISDPLKKKIEFVDTERVTIYSNGDIRIKQDQGNFFSLSELQTLIDLSIKVKNGDLNEIFSKFQS